MVGPLIRPGKPQLVNTAIDSRRNEAVRRANQDWRKWYKTRQWADLKRAVLDRDGWTCRQTGVLLTGVHPAPNSPTVDHARPHRGVRSLFFDPANCQAVSKLWHDTVKQAVERAAESNGAAQTHPEWLGRSLVPVTLVCGPPGSGKSTLVDRRRSVGDLVIDLDQLAAMISGEPEHEWSSERWLGPALRARNAVLGQLSRRADWPRAWFIVSEPFADRREWWSDRLGADGVIVLAVPRDECQRRLRADGRSAVAIDAAAKWWRAYEKSRVDTTVDWKEGQGG